MSQSVVARSSKSLVVVAALGAGILIGSGATWWLLGRRLSDAVHRLTEHIHELRREIDRLQMYIQERVFAIGLDVPRNDFPDFVDDDDDIYEDAYDG